MEPSADLLTIDTVLRNEPSREVLSAALTSTENYLLNRTPQPFSEKFIGFLRRRDPLEQRQERLIAASQRECETASVHFLSKLLPELSRFPVAAFIKSRNAMHEDAPTQWAWHTGVLLSDGDNWHVVSPANYSKETQNKRIISSTDLQEALNEFSAQEHCDWPSATFIKEQLQSHVQPYVERSKTEKGFSLPYLHAQMYLQDGDTAKATPVKLLMGM